MLPNRPQVIIQTNDVMDFWPIYASFNMDSTFFDWYNVEYR